MRSSRGNPDATLELKKSLGMDPFNKSRPPRPENKECQTGTISIYNPRSLCAKPISSDISNKIVEETKSIEKKPRDSYYGAYSYGKKIPSLCDSIVDAPSPRGLTRNRESTRESPPANIKSISDLGKSERALQVQPIKNTDVQVLKPVEISPDTMKIETRRMIIRDGGVHFEEISTIQFPKNLPSNVQVITAQFVQSN